VSSDDFKQQWSIIAALHADEQMTDQQYEQAMGSLEARRDIEADLEQLRSIDTLWWDRESSWS
jgi:capsule polysaccharide export protein KpsE/RkpR